MSNIKEILNAERIKEFEKLMDSLVLFRDFITVSIDRYQKRLDEIKEEESYELGVIKNTTGTLVLLDFSVNNNDRSKSIPVRDYIYKCDLTKEQLNSQQVRRLYRTGVFEDITLEEMQDELKEKSFNDSTYHHGSSNCESPERDIPNNNEANPTRQDPLVKNKHSVSSLINTSSSCRVLEADEIRDILGARTPTASTPAITGVKPFVIEFPPLPGKTKKKTTKKKTTNKKIPTKPAKKIIKKTTKKKIVPKKKAPKSRKKST